jgi:hypothetical protein
VIKVLELVTKLKEATKKSKAEAGAGDVVYQRYDQPAQEE